MTATFQPGPLVRCWRFFEPGGWLGDSSDAAAIADMTRAVMASRTVDPERVYLMGMLMGMSAGAFMTAIRAAAYPELYARGDRYRAAQRAR